MDSAEYRRMAEVEQIHWWYQATRKLLRQFIVSELRVDEQPTPRRFLDAGCALPRYIARILKQGAGVSMSQTAQNNVNITNSVLQFRQDFAIISNWVSFGSKVLDLGCGEGWLLRVLADRGIDAAGVDGDATLIEAARAAGSAKVHVASYAALVDAEIDIGRDYDLI